MKKITFALLFGLFLSFGTYSQMSFTGNTLKKSAFDLSSQKKSILDENNSDSKIFISDEDNDLTKKRRKKGRGRRGGGGDYSNSIKTNPLALIFGTIGVMYERKINDNMSLGLTVGMYFNNLDAFTLESKYSGFNFSPEFRYYFDQAIEGWFIGGYFSYTAITNTQKYTDGTAMGQDADGNDFFEISNTLSVISGGAMGGRQWIWGGFTLDVYAGLGYSSVSWSYDKNYDELFGGGISLEGIMPVLGSAIGYSF
jgi:hypothetical protein